MYLSLSRLSSSLVHRLARCQGHVNASRPFSVSRPPGHPESFQPDSSSSENVARNSFPPNSSENVARNPFQRGFNSSENVTGNHFRPGLNFSENFSRNPFQPSEPGFKSSENFSGNPFQPGFSSSESVTRNSLQRGLNSSENVAGNSLQYGSNSSVNVTRNSRSMNFVRGIIEEDAKNYMWGSQVPLYNIEQNADIVHVKLMRNNTFVTVTDAKGNKKLGASAGSLSEMKGGQKSSKYAAEATAEHVGRLSRNFGVKSVVMKVKGFTFFKKKRQAIVSWKEGFTSSKVGKSPIVYIEDTTRKPHNGCRLPKKRRV